MLCGIHLKKNGKIKKRERKERVKKRQNCESFERGAGFRLFRGSSEVARAHTQVYMVVGYGMVLYIFYVLLLCTVSIHIHISIGGCWSLDVCKPRPTNGRRNEH
jgi:hypothetical protein